jgi:hypothetical protein
MELAEVDFKLFAQSESYIAGDVAIFTHNVNPRWILDIDYWLLDIEKTMSNAGGGGGLILIRLEVC